MSMQSPSRLRPVLIAAVLTLGFAAGFTFRGSNGAAVAEEDAATLAKAQLTRFYDALAGRGALEDVLGDGFQLMRTDGTRYDRASYLARPPAYSAYELGDIQASLAGDVLTATYFTGVTGKMDDRNVASQDQPRLAVFTRTGGEWKLQALANLGAGLITDAAEAGKKAVDGWVGAVASGDAAAIAKVLAPEFQIVRSDGTAYGAEEYLQSEFPRFPEPPAIGSLVVTGFGDTLVARYEITSKILLGEETEMRDAPRLTVFRRGPGGSWLVVAHSNFAALHQ